MAKIGKDIGASPASIEAAMEKQVDARTLYQLFLEEQEAAPPVVFADGITSKAWQLAPERDGVVLLFGNKSAML